MVCGVLSLRSPTKRLSMQTSLLRSRWSRHARRNVGLLRPVLAMSFLWLHFRLSLLCQRRKPCHLQLLACSHFHKSERIEMKGKTPDGR